MTTKITTATRLAAEFKGSPRYPKIVAVLQAVDDLGKTSQSTGLGPHESNDN